MERTLPTVKRLGPSAHHVNTLGLLSQLALFVLHRAYRMRDIVGGWDSLLQFPLGGTSLRWMVGGSNIRDAPC